MWRRLQSMLWIRIIWAELCFPLELWHFNPHSVFSSVLFFHPNHCICLAPSIPSPLVVAFAIRLPPTLSFFSLSSSFSLPSSCSPFNLPGLQWRRGRGNSMVTWHSAISLHCQLILAYRHAAVPCQPTSHHAPDIPRPVYRAGELQSTYNLQPLDLVLVQSLAQNTQKQTDFHKENKE